jgi:hypothetical protein
MLVDAPPALRVCSKRPFSLSKELGIQSEKPSTFSSCTANTVLKLNRLLEQTLMATLAEEPALLPLAVR